MGSKTQSIIEGNGQVEEVEVQSTPPIAEEEGTSIWRLLLADHRIVAYAVLANCGSLLFGFDVLVQGGITALPAFSMYYGSAYGESMILPALWQGLWAACNSMGIMFGAAVNGTLQDRFGRRPMFAVGGAIAALAAGLAYVSSDLAEVDGRRGMLLLSKFILGVSMGIEMSTGQTYVSEISPPRLRTVLLGLFPFLLCLGQMIAVSVVFSRISDFTPNAFKVPFASQWAFAGLAIVATLLLPESPVYYMNKGKFAGATKTLQRLYGPKRDISELAQKMQSTIEHEQATMFEASAITYSECFKGSDSRRTRIVALLNSLQQFIGISLISNSTYFFIVAGMSPTQTLTINQIGVGLSMVGTLVSWFIMSRFGRRSTILGGFVIAGVLFLAMGIAGCFPSNSSSLNFLGVSVILAGLTSNLTVGTAYPVVAAEISSVRLRAKTLGIGFVVNAFMTWAFSFCVPYMFNADQGNLGGKIGFVFLGTCVIGFVLSWLEIPETKNITYAHLDYLFEKGVATREFKKGATVAGDFSENVADQEKE